MTLIRDTKTVSKGNGVNEDTVKTIPTFLGLTWETMIAIVPILQPEDGKGWALCVTGSDVHSIRRPAPLGPVESK